MDKPDALRLADWLEDQYDPTYNQEQTAAALRRLHAENERLHQANEAFSRRQEWWNEKMFALEAQRDALLEALRALVRNEGLDAYSYLDKGIGTATAAGKRWLNARAAIKTVEGEKT